MPTINQLIQFTQRPQKQRGSRVPSLHGKPMRKATCVKVFTTTPRKPNSALRKVARIKYRLVEKGRATVRQTFAFIPGEGHSLKEHAVVLFRGGRTQDLPGYKYKLLRGKLDFKGLTSRRSGRSKYGTKKPSSK